MKPVIVLMIGRKYEPISLFVRLAIANKNMIVIQGLRGGVSIQTLSTNLCHFVSFLSDPRGINFVALKGQLQRIRSSPLGTEFNEVESCLTSRPCASNGIIIIPYS